MTSKKSAKVRQPGWLNKKEICLSLGITQTAFDKWGLIPVGQIGREKFFTCQQAVEYKTRKLEDKYEELLNAANEESEYLDLDQQRARKASADADAQEMKNAVTRRELAPIQIFEVVLGQVGSQIRSQLSTIKSVLKRNVPGLKTRDLKHVEKIVTKASNAISKLEIDWEDIEGFD